MVLKDFDVIESLFLEYAAEKLLELTGRIEACLAKLSDDQIWSRGHETENAVGNLVLHLRGNVTQWIIATLGNQTDHRDRDGEFEAREGPGAAELAVLLRGTVATAVTVIRNLATAQLTTRYEIQNYSVSGVDVVFHVVEHFAQHTGQIIFATKMLIGEDMGFYRHLSHPSHTERLP